MLILPLFFCIYCNKNKVNSIPDYLKPGSPEHLMNDGFICLNAGDLVQAEKFFLQALQKKPNFYNAIYALGIVYLQRGEPDRAEKYFLRTLRLKPDHIDVHNFLGVIYTETGKYDLAKEHLVIAANSNSYDTPENAYANLARLEIEHNKYESARRYLEKGLVKNNEFAPLLNYLGIILEHEGNYREAIFNYEKAIAAREDVSYLINIGRVYIKIGQKEKALDVLEQALSKAKSDRLREKVRVMIKNLEK
jgi:Tfp pilus assembly protein PilF